MIKFLILLLLFTTTNSFGQTINSKDPDTLVRSIFDLDSSLQIIYVDKLESEDLIAFFINGKFVMNKLLDSIDPKKVEDVNVVRGDTMVNNVRYNGKIYIKTRDDYYYYNAIPISLTELKNKYTNLKGIPAIFLIDGSIIKADYDSYMIDEKNLLTIIVDKFQNAKENIDIRFIEVITKSVGNMKKRRQIYLRKRFGNS